MAFLQGAKAKLTEATHDRSHNSTAGTKLLRLYLGYSYCRVASTTTLCLFEKRQRAIEASEQHTNTLHIRLSLFMRIASP